MFIIQARRWVEEGVATLLSELPDEIFLVWNPAERRSTVPDGLRMYAAQICGIATTALVVIDHLSHEQFAEGRMSHWRRSFLLPRSNRPRRGTGSTSEVAPAA